MSEDGSKSTALALPSDRRLARHAPAPELKLARTLDEAGPDAVVILDRHGDLVPWTRLRFWSAASQGLSLTLIAVLSLSMVEWLGWVGLLTPIVAAFTMARRRNRWSWEWRAMALIQSDRCEEAEVLCRAILERRGGGLARTRRMRRSWAHRCLAIIASRRGDPQAALTEVRAALRLVAADRPQAVNELLFYQEVRLLCDVGQVGEARALLEGRPRPERGEVVQVQRGLTELYLQFYERRLTLEDEQLWERSQRALKLSGGAQLLALCAWGFVERHDQEMAAHLLEQAVDRFVPWMKHSSPLLWQWVEARIGRSLEEERGDG